MFKPTKLLKVMSIVLIVFGVLGLILTVIAMLAMGQLKSSGVDTTALEQSTSTLNLAIGIVLSFVQIAVAILALKGKMRKIVMAGGLVLVLYSIYGLVTIFTIDSGFQVLSIVTSLIGLLFPLLFFWGAYQSDEV